jgi:hypothetical protein
MKNLFLAAAFMGAVSAAQAAYPPITNIDHVLTWTDSSGKPRSMTFSPKRPQVTQMSYFVDGSLVTDKELNHAVGEMVDHGSCGATVSSQKSSNVVKSVALAGADHYIVRYTFKEARCGSGGFWQVTEDWEFVNGQDAYIETVAYDSSDLPADKKMVEDLRGPYSQTTWPGGGPVSGVAWGDEWKFSTTSPINCGACTYSCGPAAKTPCKTTWTYGGSNTIPYVWSWASPGVGGAVVDREWGIVQNLPTQVMDFGGAYYGAGGMPTVAAIKAGAKGDVMPECWAVPGQHNCYDSAWNSGRTTWGAPYAVFNNGHSNASYTMTMGDLFRPVAGWSWMNLIDKYSSGGVRKLVEDTENIFKSSLTAKVGKVITQGPRGPGNYVGPGVGGQVTKSVMPTLTYSNPGFDHIYRTWNLEAAQGNADFSLKVSGGLTHPSFVIFSFPASAPCRVTLGGIAQVQGKDYMADYDAPSKKLWLTFNKNLAAGDQAIQILSSCGK